MQLKNLVARCKKRDRKAQEQLYRMYGDKLYTLCLRYSRNRREAEDNLQDSFIRIFDRIDQFKFKGSFEGWLRRVTLTTVLQKYRQDGVLELVGTQEIPETEEAGVENENIDLEQLLRFVQELPDQYRITFSLYVLDDYSHKEIAAMLNISEGTSKSNLARGKAILRKRITEIKEVIKSTN